MKIGDVGEALAYHQECIRHIQDTFYRSEVNDGYSNFTINETLMETLNEFAQLVLVDVELKRVAFKSREIFIIVHHIISLQIKDEFDMTVNLGSKHDLSLARQRLLERMMLFNSSLCVVAHLLYHSDNIEERIGVISEIK